MSIFAAALEVQDGVSFCSTKSVDDCKPVALCHDDEAANHMSTDADVDDDEAAGHNCTATIGEAVPAYRFMAWLDGEPDLLGMEDRFFFVEMSTIWLTMKTMKTTTYHSYQAKVAPQSN
jgi:hypothetical protein